MASYTFDEETLSKAAGVDPWQMHRDLLTGDPAAIENLASQFYRASGDLKDANATAATSQSYVRQGYTVQGSSPLDASAEAHKLVRDPHIGAVHTQQIAKILVGVGTDLDTATKSAGTEVSTLNTAIAGFVKDYSNYVFIAVHTGEARDDPSGTDAAEAAIWNKAVAATKTHGATVKTLLTGYETSLHKALKSMADLGYVPADGHDEGPGGIDLTAGTHDGSATVTAARSGDKGGLQRSTYAVSIINDAIAHDGGHVSDDNYTYLSSYYGQTAGHSDVIWNAVKNDPSLKGSAGRNYANGLLNLTRGSEQTNDEGVPPYAHADFGPGSYGRGGVSGLPQSVQDVLNSDIGKVQNSPQFAGADGPMMRRAEWVGGKNGHWVVDNYDNDTGFSDLLTLAGKGQQGGNQFSQTLAESGLRWKQQESAVQTNTANWVASAYDVYNSGGHGLRSTDPDAVKLGFPPDTNPDHYHLNINDDGASNALATAARNSYASASVLNNTADRHQVIGLNWDNGSGAGQLIVSGTAPDPHNTMIDPATGKSIRNEATLHVMQDVGSDYQTLAAHANGAVKTALTTVAIDHLDSLAGPNTGRTSDTLGTIVLPGGHTEQGLELTTGTSGNFLKAIATFGPQRYGMLHAAALQQGAQWIHDAPPGSATPGDTGAAFATRLDGRVTGAGYAAAQEIAATDAHHDQKNYAAELVEQQNEATHDLLKNVAFQTVEGGLDIATLGASEHVGKILDVFSTANGIIENGADDYADYNSSDANSAYIQHLQSQVQTALNSPAGQAQVHQALGQDQTWMAIKAASFDPHHTITVGGRPVDVSHLLDANGNPDVPTGQLVLSDGSASPSVTGNGYATSDSANYDVVQPLDDHVYGGLRGGTQDAGIDDVVGSHEGNGVSWDPTHQVVYGDDKTYSWTPDYGTAGSGIDDYHEDK